MPQEDGEKRTKSKGEQKWKRKCRKIRKPPTTTGPVDTKSTEQIPVTPNASKNWYANVQKEEQKERTRSWRYYDDPDLKYTAYAVTEEYIDYVEDEYGEYEHIDC